jgi:rsbT antagonist protein RsbS
MKTMGTNIPILSIEGFLVVSINVDLHDQVAVQLQEDILNAISRTGSRGLLIDVTALETVDSFMGRILGFTGSMAKLMGAETVLSGLQPEVAITLVELGLDFPELKTALNMEKGLEMLRRLVGNGRNGS